ncbi:hypothetical protein BLX24_09495 [Arsenicibacter rosenii]|uniref:Carboxypeptidase-like regulatory domain-containing protein n=1 Tax=Arsenicibacter rosenii TaxID=1750698 RepID=A0A1S2VMW9_9BACT|nr:hypothetical protein BLX24_09495 [Arsenicibacter rosenii]
MLSCILLSVACGQSNPLPASFTITGIITDAHTGEPIPFASVMLADRRTGVVANEQGHYLLQAKSLSDTIIASSLGYHLYHQAINRKRPFQTIDIQLQVSGTALQEIIVKAGENPAFRILRNIRNNRHLNDRNRLAAYECDNYIKTQLALSDRQKKHAKSRLFKRIEAAMSSDSLIGDDGQRLLPFFVSESVSRYYHRSNPQSSRDHMLKTRIKGVAVDDGEFSSQLLGSTNLLSQNFYNTYIPILGKDFASPIGENGKVWYTFFLADTVQIGDHICYEIQFDPKRKEDLAFTGKAWIDTTTYALCQIEAHVGNEANLNYVQAITIEQELEPVNDSISAGHAGWLPVVIRLSASIAGVSKQVSGLQAAVVLRSSNYIINKPRPLYFYQQPLEPSDTVATANDTYWQIARKNLAGADSLSEVDVKAREMIDKLRDVPVIKTAENIGQVLLTGYYRLGGIDIGPYPYMLAVNRMEGLRMRIGLRTNDQFSRNWIIKGYLAYGTLDRQIKYTAELSYLFSRQRWTVAGIRLTKDIERLGFNAESTGRNHLVYAFNRFGRLGGAYQNTQDELFMRTEPVRGILLTATLGSRIFNPLFPFRYRLQPTLGDLSPLESTIYDSYWTFEARLARKEKYLINGNERVTLGTKRAPVLTFRYTRSLQYFGGDFHYDRFTLHAQQSLRLGASGRFSYLLSTGFTPSHLPVPLLFAHVGNPALIYSGLAFNRLQFFEFASDRFIAAHVQHRFEGLLFNSLPGIRRLNWRFIVNADVLWGSRSSENQQFDTQDPLPDGKTPTRFGMPDGAKPYVEVGYGIENIFKFFQIQAIHRLTYNDNTMVSPFALKVAATISF